VPIRVCASVDLLWHGCKVQLQIYMQAHFTICQVAFVHAEHPYTVLATSPSNNTDACFSYHSTPPSLSLNTNKQEILALQKLTGKSHGTLLVWHARAYLFDLPTPVARSSGSVSWIWVRSLGAPHCEVAPGIGVSPPAGHPFHPVSLSPPPPSPTLFLTYHSAINGTHNRS